MSSTLAPWLLLSGPPNPEPHQPPRPPRPPDFFRTSEPSDPGSSNCDLPSPSTLQLLLTLPSSAFPPPFCPSALRSPYTSLILSGPEQFRRHIPKLSGPYCRVCLLNARLEVTTRSTHIGISEGLVWSSIIIVSETTILRNLRQLNILDS